MTTSLAIPVFELKPFAKLRFRKEFALHARENTYINLPEINYGNLTVQLVTKKHAGSPPIPSGNNADLAIFHNGIRMTTSFELKPALDGSGIARTATTLVKTKDSLWKVYVENKKNVLDDSFQLDGEPFFLLVEYNSSYPIKTKTIPMSFWQRAFDKFWNNYKPIENIKVDYNFDLPADQLSLGAIFQLLLLIKNEEYWVTI
jgi:hypothetical protein